MNEIKIPLSEVKKLMETFVKDEVHLGDFDQGQHLEDTLGIFRRWWAKNTIKYKGKKGN